MDQDHQTPFDIGGSYNGNRGNDNTFGSFNAAGNVLVVSNGPNSWVANQSSGVSAGDRATRPHHVIPYGRNSAFTGRKSLLESVRESSESSNRVALYGLGGSGKTQIALEYVHLCTKERNCDVFWVQGSGISKFSEGLRAIGQHVGIPLDSAETNEESSLLGIRRWFEGPDSGDWILVIDNADNEDDFDGTNSSISKFIPQGTKGTVIFTTRSLQVGLWQNCAMIEVGKMGEEEAQELFSKKYNCWDSLEAEERQVAAKILDSVHHTALAVVGSAAFMAATQTLPSSYWTMLQEQETKLLSQQVRGIQRDIPESVLTTYFVTFVQIAQQMPLAADLLRLIAFFDCENIPEELLRQCGLRGIDDSVEFRLAIGKICGFSLVTLIEREEGKFYELHPLVQLSLQAYLTADERDRWEATALRLISQFFPRSEKRWRSGGPAYIHHALAVTKNSKDPVAEELGYRMGQYFLYIGSDNNAEIQFRRCIALRKECKKGGRDNEGRKRLRLLGLASAYQGKANVAEKIFRALLGDIEGPLDPNRPHCLQTVGHLVMVLRDQGKYHEAEAMSWRALECCEEVLGPDHPSTLASVSNLASVLRDQGKYNESEAMNRRVLEQHEKAHGPDHADTITSVYHLSSVLQDQGKYHEAEAMSRRVLEWCEERLGSDHPNTLASVSNLASVLQDRGEYSKSEEMNRRVLERHENALGPDHPDTLKSVSGLALVLRCQGRYNESESMNRRVLEGYQKALGPDHPDTLISVNNLAVVLRYQEKYDELEKLNRRAMEGCKKDLGPDHPDTLISVNNLAVVLRYQEKYDESEKLNRRALEASQTILGGDHPDTIASANNLAAVLQCQGKYDESEVMNRRALEGYEKVLGPNHPQTLTSINDLSSVLKSQGKFDESETMNRRALAGHEKGLGPDHPNTLMCANNLALVLRCQGKYEESEAMNWHALEGYQRVLGPNHPDTLISFHNMASLLEFQGNYSELEITYRRALEGHEKVLEPDHPNTLKIATNLAALLYSQGKYDESEAIRWRALEGYEKVLGPDHRDTLQAADNLGDLLQIQGKYEESQAMYRRAHKRTT